MDLEEQLQRYKLLNDEYMVDDLERAIREFNEAAHDLVQMVQDEEEDSNEFQDYFHNLILYFNQVVERAKNRPYLAEQLN